MKNMMNSNTMVPMASGVHGNWDSLADAKCGAWGRLIGLGLGSELFADRTEVGGIEKIWQVEFDVDVDSWI